MSDIMRLENGQLSAYAVNMLIVKEREAKKAKEEYEALKAELLQAMEKNNVIKIENDVLLINYIAPTESERLDTKALKENCPELYDEFVTFTKVKSSVRIKVK